MIGARRVSSNVAKGLCLFIGIGLAIQMDRFLRTMPSIVRRNWYESEYLSFFVACVVLVALGLLRPDSPREHFWNGLLVTGPPYAWYTTAVIVSWLQASGHSDALVHLKAFAAGVTLALSGAAVGAASCFVIGLVTRRLDRAAS